MKFYWVFYEAGGGLSNIMGTFKTLEEAEQFKKELEYPTMNIEIVDVRDEYL